MKTSNLIKTVMTVAALVATLSTATTAQAKSTAEAAKEVKSLHLSQDPYGNELLTRPSIVTNNGGRLFLPNKIQGNGIPDSPVNPGDLSRRRPSVQAVVQNTLEQVKQMPLGQQITAYGTAVQRVSRLTNLSDVESAGQVILNRSFDLAESIFDVAGNNTEMVAQVLANIYRNGFLLATQVMNNPQHYCAVIGRGVGGWYETAGCSEARVGIAFARLAFSSSGQSISESAKGIMLIKTMGFLGWDLNMDPIRREQGISDVILRIADIQNGQSDSMVVNPTEIQAYQVILQSLESGVEPNRMAMNVMRKAVHGMLTSAAQSEAQISQYRRTR